MTSQLPAGVSVPWANGHSGSTQSQGEPAAGCSAPQAEVMEFLCVPGESAISLAWLLCGKAIVPFGRELWTLRQQG
jgi:hypothetical protein